MKMHKNYNEKIQIPILNEILKKSRRLRFDADKHKYHLDTFELTSVTTHIDKYRNEFESQKIANSLCKKYNEKYSLNNKHNQRKPEYYIQLWNAKREMSCNKGTMIHLYAESYPYFDNSELKEHDYIINYFDDLNENMVYIGSEIRVYSTSLQLAGTIDLLLYNTKTNKFSIVDFKTNKDIYKSDSGFFKEPYEYMKNTKINSYTLQLNFYKYCFEEMFKDVFSVEQLDLVWLNDNNDNYKLINLNIINAFN